MDDPRLSIRNPGQTRAGQYVLYWMQQSQRVEYNHALAYAIQKANELQLPLQVGFVLSDQIPNANLRHYQFMLQGLHETALRLLNLGVGFIIGCGGSSAIIGWWSASASMLVCDRGYGRWQREWRNALNSMDLTVHELESDVVVPVETASNKEEFAAATLRPKLLRRITGFLEPTELPFPNHPTRSILPTPKGIPCLPYFPDTQLTELLDFAYQHLKLDRGVSPTWCFKGGYLEARKWLDGFLENKLYRYATERNNPANEIQSGLSPYLHFGQISSLEVALRALNYTETNPLEVPSLIKNKSGLDPLRAGLASFLEELIVRRELACNFCNYNPDYDNYACVPLWARQSLNDHLGDPRPHEYSLDRLESADTDDIYWNSAQTEMVKTGKMHNYMRMYWGKKLIEWNPDPEAAFQVMVYLNDKYELDGRDPNSYAGIAWCFGKHDRPWGERAVFGKVRYMNANGLTRKFDMKPYQTRVLRLKG